MRHIQLLSLLAALTVAACANTEHQEPVEECQQYDDLMATCMHRDSRLAMQPSLIPKTKADRERIARTCRDNLQRLRLACR